LTITNMKRFSTILLAFCRLYHKRLTECWLHTFLI